MIKIPDAASLSALRCLQTSLGRRCGGSTGTNFIAALHLAREMHEAGRQGSIVTVLCDSGERYTQTYYNDDWLADRGFKDKGRLEAATKAFRQDGAALPWRWEGRWSGKRV